MLYLLIILGVLILIIVMPIKTKIKTIQKEENQILVINIRSIYGLLNFKFEIPYMDIILKGFKPALKYKADTKGNKILSLFEIKKIYKIYKHNKISMKKLINYIIKKTRIKDFFINLKLGTEDVYYTALLYGISWAFLGSTTYALINNSNIAIQDIAITPILDKKAFEYELSCIITIKAGHIIIIGIKALPILLHTMKNKASHS